MKFILLFISLVLIDNGCSKSKLNQNNISFEYTAQSRDPYQCIKINKKLISVENKRDSTPISKICVENDWSKLIKAVKPIDIENISTLKAPTKDRLFDGAAIANLKIIYNGYSYETQSFDHGNPPKEIAELVKQILSITQNIE